MGWASNERLWYDFVRRGKVFYWFLKIILGPLVRLVWVKNVQGLENIPKRGPLIVAANHSSYFDFLTLVAVFPRRIHFLAAEVFYKSAFWKPIMILTGQIKVDRNSSDKSGSIKKITEALNKDKVVGFFPEGTRSRTGRLQRAYTGVAKTALVNKVDILPIAIKGTYQVMAPDEKNPKFDKVIEIKYLPVILYQKNKRLNKEQITHELLMNNIAKEIGQEYPKESR